MHGLKGSNSFLLFLNYPSISPISFVMKLHLRTIRLLCLFLLGVCQAAFTQPSVTPSTALSHYVNKADNAYQWQMRDSYEVGGVRAYRILLTSQQWRSLTWKHELIVLVPPGKIKEDALLFISGGSVGKEGLPNWSSSGDAALKMFAGIASQNGAIVSMLKQTPNQPLFNGLYEDALISYTLHRYKSDNDYTWPLLFPMVKSACRAMDAVQEFSKSELQHSLKGFVVSGASKRGWTTWLTAATDSRVKGIVPMVIDMLNIPVSMKYQITNWNDYSPQIQDYVKLGLVQDMGSGLSNDLVQMIDPYSYRKVLTMPKLMIMGTNDEYWTVDNVKNYFNELSGNKQLKYVANVGHNLGDFQEAADALSAFFGYTVDHKDYPVCSWKLAVSQSSLKLDVANSGGKVTEVTLWEASSPDRDFRNDRWSSRPLKIAGAKRFIVSETLPSKGYKAFYLDLKYINEQGRAYRQSTRVFLLGSSGVL